MLWLLMILSVVLSSSSCVLKTWLLKAVIEKRVKGRELHSIFLNR